MTAAGAFDRDFLNKWIRCCLFVCFFVFRIRILNLEFWIQMFVFLGFLSTLSCASFAQRLKCSSSILKESRIF